MQVVVLAGLATHQDFHFEPSWVTASVQLAIHVNDFLFISPECAIFLPDLKFNPSFYWSPGVALNYKFGDIFIGAGPFRWIESSKENLDLRRFWQLKGQIGLLKNNFCVTVFAFMSTESPFKEMTVGLVAGVVI